MLIVVLNALRYGKRKLRSVFMGLAAALTAVEIQLYRIDTSVWILGFVGVIIFAILVLDFVFHATSNPISPGGPQ